MAKLSQNWKKLSSKIQDKPKNGSVKKPTLKGKISKKVKASISEKLSTTNNTTTTTTTTTSTTDVVPIASSTKPTATPLEYTLWTQNHTINVSHIPKTPKPLPLSRNDTRKLDPGKYVAIDCEFVGIGKDGEESALARISIINYYGVVLLDTYVRPQERVTDWRTWVSGIQSYHMQDAIDFKTAQLKTMELINNKILVGHAVNNDLDILFLSHPKSMIRDTCKFPKFREIAGGKSPSLKKLIKHFIQVDIQIGQHSSVEDARATMLLFRLFKREIEQSMRNRNKRQ